MYSRRGWRFPQFEKKNQINTKNDELNLSLIMKTCTMSGFFNENFYKENQPMTIKFQIIYHNYSCNCLKLDSSL